MISRNVTTLTEAINQFDAGELGNLLTRFAAGDILPEAFAARFEWRPLLKAGPARTPVFKPKGHSRPARRLGRGESATSSSSQPPSIGLTSTSRPAPEVQPGPLPSQRAEPEIDVDFKEFVFGGPLSFIEILRDLIPLEGFADRPRSTSPRRGSPRASATALPNIAVGVFSLENLSLAAGFSVPFVGQPMTTWFRFCEPWETRPALR